MKRRNKIIIRIASVLLFLILIAAFIFNKLSDIGVTHVSYTFSIEESKDLGVFIGEYRTIYSVSVDDSLHKYNLPFKICNLKCWIENGFEYKPVFFYYKVVKKDHFRLNYRNPAVTNSQSLNPQFYIEIKGTDCKDIELFQDFSSIYLKSCSDTIKCDAYLFFNNTSENCKYIGDVLLVK